MNAPLPPDEPFHPEKEPCSKGCQPSQGPRHPLAAATARPETDRLRASEARYQRLFETAKDGILILDADTGQIEDVNPFLCQLLGYAPEDFLGKQLWELSPFRDIADNQEAFRALQEKEYLRYEDLPLETKTGQSASVEFVSNVYICAGRKVIQCNIRDIHERKQMAAAKQEAQRFLQATLDALASHIAVLDVDGTIVAVNKAWQQFSAGNEGGAATRGVGVNYLGICDQAKGAWAEEAPAVARGIRAVIAGEQQGFSLEYPCHSPEEQRWFNVGVTRFGGEGPVHVVVAHENITARKRTETQQHVLQKVREQVWRMSGIDDIHRVLIAIREGLEAQQLAFRDCGINLIDRAADPPSIRFHHITREEGWRFSDILTEDREGILHIWRSGEVTYHADLETEDRCGRERVPRTPPGVRSVMEVPFTHGTLELNSTRPAAFSALDIEFLQELAAVLSEGFRRLDDLQTIETTEAQFRQAQKLEALGQLAGGVAHDFNNLLTVTSGYCELLLRERPVDHPDYTPLQEIRSAAERGTNLVRQLLAFGRKQVLVLKVLDLSTVVRDLEKILGRLIGEDVEMAVQLAPDLGRVKADQGQLEQVLVNLVVNARDAMPQGGRLIIEAYNVELDQAYMATHTATAPGAYVLLEVSDTGTGMDEATQARIFEPFFTTKGPGKGTGLGLATVYGIVKQSGGHIWVYSEPGQGTTFKIYLPRVEEETQVVDQGDLAQHAIGSETLLLVEDEAPLRRLATLLLREAGYTVLAASHGEEALELSARYQGPIHAVVSDMVMPRMSGSILAEQLLVQRPELRVLFVSGYSEDIIQQRGVPKSGAAFLQKPFRANALLLKVREVLDRKQS